ncbi:helix-turn-helix domain-containing protein [Nonomuraea dietziae]|uniref:helix-turn-helix domain-containing protein n=1 Tax=Nonomuraea dietziae TaxID=65515 RepID=UPI0033FE4115
MSRAKDGAGPGGARLAAALQRFRVQAGLSRRELAARADIDRSVLSRLERGAYPHQVRSETLSRLSAVLNCGDSLHLAAGTASPGVQDLSPMLQQVHSALGETAIREGLRRLELTAVASAFEARILSRDGKQVDEMRLCREVGTATGEPLEPRGGCSSAQPAWRRFWIGHDAAHTILKTICKWPYVLSEETDANYLAGLLLAPDRLVQAAVRNSLLRELRPAWTPDCGGVVGEVAERLMIPGWVAVRRIAESGHLDYYLPSAEEEA